MNRRIVTRGVLVLTLVLGACAGSTEPDDSRQPLTVEARAGALVLSNTGPRAVRYVGLVSGALALVTEPAQWPELAPSQTTELRNDRLIAYTPQATRATILWAVDGRIGDPLEVELR